MRHVPPVPPPKTHVRAAWPAPRTAAERTPGRWPDLGRRRDGLRPRVAAYDAHLQALPRRVRRALQRRWRVPLATLALWLALGQLPALAATIPVGGACMLVDAMTAANTDTATGGCSAGSGADTIVLPPGSTQTLMKVHNDTYGPTGLPVISSVITIAGQGSTIARAAGAPEFRLLEVHSTGDLTLQETTVSGGAASTYYYGGGVLNVGGSLTITNSTIAGTTAGSGVANSYGGTLTITNSTISGNTGGGGVRNDGGTLTITNSTISGNSGYFPGYIGAFGGGMYTNNGIATITNSIIADNTGGGVASAFGTLTITNSTISGNTGQGGVDVATSTGTITNSTILGNTSSGVENVGSTLTITNSTISGNTAGVGGGVLNRGYFDSYSRSYIPGTVIITNSTISGNTASVGGGIANYRNGYTPSDLTLIRTLVTGNTAPTGAEVFNNGMVVADAHNLFGLNGHAGVEGFSPGATDVVPPAGVILPDILEPTLALHGGRTPTHALVPGSPAIDAGGPACLDATGTPLTNDQRGRPRPIDGNGDGVVACDIGAVEFFPLVNDLVTLDPDLDTGFDPTPVSGGPAGSFTVTATFTNTSATSLRVPFFEVTALSGGNLLRNADGGSGGVGATLTPDVGDGVLAPGETVAVDFVLGLQGRAPFTFVVELFGEPVP